MAVKRDEVNLIVTMNAAPAGNSLKDLQKEARDLRRALERIPVGSKEFDDAAAKLRAVNLQISEAQAKTKVLSKDFADVGQKAGGLRGILQGVLTVFGGFSLAGLVQQGLSFVGTLFNMSTSLDALDRKTKTVFGEAEAVVRGFAETNAKALGLSRQQYIDLATASGDLLKPMGFTEEAVANLSSAIQNQAGILSQWSGGKVDSVQASEILNKALLGERDALNSLGIDIKDSLIQDELKKKGLQDLTGESKRQAEALITLELVTKQSASANEAFAAGGDSAARKQAELRARVAGAVQSLARGFVPVMNKVFEVLGPVIDYLVQFGTRMATAYQNAETFRAVVGGAFAAVGVVIQNAFKTVAAFSEGLLGLFEGNFSAAIDSFKQAFATPFETGADIKKAFVAGFASVKNPQTKVETGDAKKEGTEFANAFAGGFDAEFEKLKNAAKGKAAKAAKEKADKEAKEALDLRLKEIELAYLKEELVADNQRAKGQLNESNYARQILILKKQQYQQQLEALREFNQLETKEALAAQKALLEIQQQLDTPKAKLAAVPTIGTKQPGQVTSQTAAGLAGADVSAANDPLALRQKFAEILTLEQANELARQDIQRNALNARLEFLRNAGLQETEVFKATLAEKQKADEEYQATKLENERRTEELRKQIQQTSYETAADFFQLGIDLLSQDEKARKKNAGAIKAFQIAQVIVQGVSEVQKIWSTAAELGPIAGSIIGALQTALAVGRTGLAISKIASTKFALGGMARVGYFGGKPHSAGGTKGYFDDGTAIEVERGEAFAIVNKRNAPMLRTLSAINSAGGHGVPFFARGGLPRFDFGGLPTVNTTPAASQSLTLAAQPAQENMMQFVESVKQFDEIVRRFPTEVKSRVVYTEITSVAAEVEKVQADASI